MILEMNGFTNGNALAVVIGVDEWRMCVLTRAVSSVDGMDSDGGNWAACLPVCASCSRLLNLR